MLELTALAVAYAPQATPGRFCSLHISSGSSPSVKEEAGTTSQTQENLHEKKVTQQEMCPHATCLGQGLSPSVLCLWRWERLQILASLSPVFRECPFYKPNPLIPPSALCHAVRSTSMGLTMCYSNDISVKLFLGVGESELSQAICLFVSTPLALPWI